ncbi:MAG: hypothetical protein NTY66_03700 [Candidatus Vogelbacteria bacterium]|nr:hypothetical protein [Candidatus Vogelbacteria bacterium]
MFIITVAPIGKGVFREELSYFSADNLPVGAVISVPIKSGHLEALVIESRRAEEMKSELKNSTFSLKKIGSLKHSRLFTAEFISACRATADHFAITLGQTISTTVPRSILSGSSPNNISGKNQTEKPGNGTLKQHKFILQDDSSERLSYYKALIRESFAKKESVFLCLSSTAEVDYFSHSFPGIADYTVTFSGGLTEKVIQQNWTRALSIDHPILVIATPNFLCLPREDLRTIIIENEGSSHYRTIARPYLDYRVLAEKLAVATGARLIFGDLVLRTETIFRSERGDLAHLSGLKYRSVSTAEQMIVSTHAANSSDKSDQAIGDRLFQILTDSFAAHEKAIIYCGRKSLSPITICRDCGQVVHCQNCKSPLSLHKDHKKKKYYYLCHKCGQERIVEDTCPACGSWRLSLLGFGSEKAEQELALMYPAVPIFRLDGETAKPLKRVEIVKKFLGTKGAAILLGTEVMLSALSEKVPTVAVIGLDAIFSVPDFRISEKVLSALLHLRGFASQRFVIETHNPDEKVYHYATTGNLIDFYREEIEERMKFGYPPFKTLVLVSHSGEPEEVRKKMSELEQLLSGWSPLVYETDHADRHGRFEMRCLLKLPIAAWVEQELLSRLRSLTPDWKIEIEPESII